VRHRTLGRTGSRVSEIGLGAWAMGGMWGPLGDRTSLKALQRAMDLGVNFIDTALAYGEGHSESLIAKAFRERGERVFVATKVPPKNYEWPAQPDDPLSKIFPSDWIIRCTERSLENLQTDCLDLQQLHVWADAWTDQSEWYETLMRLKEEGKIRSFGVSVNDHEPDSVMRLVASGKIDTIQVIYNLFDQTPGDRLLPLCREKNVGVIARCPFDEGSLTGRLEKSLPFHKDDWRNRYFKGDRLKETLARVEELKFLVHGEQKSLAQAVLKFCLSHPAVSTVIPGMRRPEHVEENCAVSGGLPLQPEELEQIRAHAWPRNFY
jgi:aryl-alcohol dehydrogenase-like predicted oxidoreductase